MCRPPVVDWNVQEGDSENMNGTVDITGQNEFATVPLFSEILNVVSGLRSPPSQKHKTLCDKRKRTGAKKKK